MKSGLFTPLLKGSRFTFLLFSAFLLFSFASPGPAFTKGTVFHILVTDTVDPGLFIFIRRVFARAKREDARGVILEINSTGGMLHSCLKIKDVILNSEQLSVAFIRNRALSAAALISVCCTKIVMQDESTIGAAAPIKLTSKNTTGMTDVEAKLVSAFRGEFESAAEKRGRPTKICAAMVDKNIAIPNIVKPGEILTLTTEKALALNLIDFNLNSRDAVVEQMGWEGCELITMEPSFGEGFVRILTDHNVSSMLLGLGSLGLVGFFFTGSILSLSGGLVCMGLVYGANLFAEISNAYAFIFLIIGILLMVAEIFVLPGFGIAGVGGIFFLILSICFNYETPWLGLLAFSKGALITILGIPIIWKMGGRSIIAQTLVLDEKISPEDGFDDIVTDDMYAHLIGQEGEAKSRLCPGGKIKIGDKRYDAVSDGDFIEKGQHVRVIDTKVNSLIVEELK
ncbi:nodulation protein NfeD [Candidatus Riflebacteria bacterium]